MAFWSRKSVLVQDLQKLAGHLNFMCQAIPMGRAFLSGIYALLSLRNSEVMHPGHHRQLNRETHDDLMMFHSFFDEMSPEHHRLVPFMIKCGVSAASIRFYVDSAGASNLGFSCCYGNRWAQGVWSDTDLFSDNFNPNITILELYEIVVAVEIWSPLIKGSELILKSDNAATCYWINKKGVQIPMAMQLLRHLTLHCLLFQIHVSANHLSSTNNRKSDLISRFRMTKFFNENLAINRMLDPIPSSLWPPSWLRQDMLPPQAVTSHRSWKTQSWKKSASKHWKVLGTLLTLANGTCGHRKNAEQSLSLGMPVLRQASP